jgi:O-acetyl-ADP-ribose deacetylase (regulator of RNase III)
MPFTIIRDDITRVKADAIVNTANPKPAIGAGTDNAIYTAAGKEKLLAARKLIGDIKPGDAIETAAYNLDAKYIIHTVCIAWDIDNETALETLKSCYKNSLDLALELNCKSIAFPLIGTGAYGFPHDEAVEIAKTVSKKFLKETGSDMKIMLVVFDKDSYESTAAVAKKIKQYIDDNYVENAVVDEYGLTDEDRRDMSTIKRRRERYFHGASNRPLNRDEQAKLDAVYDDAAKPFSVKVFELADKKGIKYSKLYGPNERYFSKQVISAMQKNSNYHPAKFVAVTICIVLELDLDETLDLLERAGYTLSRSRKADVVIRACIENGIRDYEKIDKKLEENGCEELRKLK